MKTGTSLFIIFIFSLFYSSLADDDSLDAIQSARFDTVTSRYYIQRCCFSNLRDCITRGGDCAIARRLWPFAKWLCAYDSISAKILEQIDKRYNYFISDGKFVIDTSNVPRTGDPAAPVTIVAYISASCNACKLIVGALYDSVAGGGLRHKAKLLAKPIGKGIGDIALMAAQREGKFWNLFLAMKGIKTRVTEDLLVQLADNIGIPPDRFREMLRNPQFPKSLEANKIEGKKNGVELSPTFFINQKRYNSYKNPRWVVDAALYEIERK
jgi:hypothetical protein